MKKINLFVLAILATFTSFSQPVLTAANTNLVIGETFTFNATTATIAPGNSGANQTWNFSSLATTTPVNATTSSASGSILPTASLKTSWASGATFYYNNTNIDMSISAIEASGVNMIYANPEKLLSYPFQLNSTFTDTWNTTFFNGMTFYRKGTTTVTADGNGTIVLPTGTYSDILRVKTIQVYSDSIDGLGVLYNYINEQYNYYKPGNHQPIMTIANLVLTDITGSTTENKGAYYLGTVVTSIKDYNNNDLANIEIFPNPTSRKLNVHFVENKYENLSFSLTDIKGSNFQINTLQNGNNFSLEANNIPSGIYHLTILSNNKTIGSKKIQFINE